MEPILQKHLSLCERTYDLILEENQILKETSKAPDESVLGRKRLLLEQLEESLGELRSCAAAPAYRTTTQRELINKTQQVVMKTLLLDRENEQLLLKCALASTRPSVTPKPTLNHLQQLYGKHFRG